MAKKGSKEKKSIFRKYIEAKGKGSLKNSSIKTGVEGLVATGAGMGVGAMIGKYSPLVGVLLYLGGEYMGDETNLTKAAAAGMIGYGVAKIWDHDSMVGKVSMDGVSFGAVKDDALERLTDFKNSWLKAFMLDKLFTKDNESDDKKHEEEPDESMGSVDTSALDLFENLNHQQAVQHANEIIRIEEDEELKDGYEDRFIEDESSTELSELSNMRSHQEIEALNGNYFMGEKAEIDFNTL